MPAPISPLMLIEGSQPGTSLAFARPGLGTRALHHLIFVSLCLILLILLSAGIAYLDERPTPGIILVAISCLCFVLWEITRRAHLREIRGGAIRMAGDRLEVDYPALFKDPIVIPLDSVAVAEVEDTAEADRIREESRAEHNLRFPVYGDVGGPLEDKARGFLWAETDLWSRDRPFPIRQLERIETRPNLLLLFKAPVVTPEARRRTGRGPNAPRPKEALGALALRVDAPAEADALFRMYRINSRVRESDLERVDAIHHGETELPEDAISYKEARVHEGVGAGWGILGSGLLVPFLEVWSLPIAWHAWKEGFRAQAVAMAVLALALLGLHTVLFISNPHEQTLRWMVGIGLTLFGGVVFIWHRLSGPPAED
jgi:hypothetical protein